MDGEYFGNDLVTGHNYEFQKSLREDGGLERFVPHFNLISELIDNGVNYQAEKQRELRTLPDQVLVEIGNLGTDQLKQLRMALTANPQPNTDLVN